LGEDHALGIEVVLRDERPGQALGSGRRLEGARMSRIA
jgi:hypothetical protein